MNNQRHILPELRKLFNQIKKSLDNNVNNLKEDNLTMVQLLILIFVVENQDKDIYQRDIEAELNIKRPTATDLIQKIEAKGFIRRESVENDARLKRIVLTDKTKKMNESFIEMNKSVEGIMLKKISNNEIEMFLNVIDKINKNLGENKQ